MPTSINLPPRAVIFDLDGTLADTLSLIVSSWNAAMRDVMRRDYSTAEVIARFGPTEVAMLRKELPPAHHQSAIRAFLSHYERNHAALAGVFDGVPELLAGLSRRRVPMGVMTGKGRDTADITLAALGWTNLFGNVVTGDECQTPKPAPDGVLMVARQLNVAPHDCVFVGDAPADIGAGKAAGMRTVWAGWHPVYAEQIRQLKPDVVATRPADVLGLFK
jgi:pyrophosphatase PpaX